MSIGPVDHMLPRSHPIEESALDLDEAMPEKSSRTATRQATTKTRMNAKSPPTTRTIRFARERR